MTTDIFQGLQRFLFTNVLFINQSNHFILHKNISCQLKVVGKLVTATERKLDQILDCTDMSVYPDKH